MSYAVVAERQGLCVFNRSASAADALDLAIARRRAGAHAVYVRDETWTLVPATVLEATAVRDRTQGLQPSLNPAAPFKQGGETARVPSRGESAPQRTGRVRVFKAAAQRSQS